MNALTRSRDLQLTSTPDRVSSDRSPADGPSTSPKTMMQANVSGVPEISAAFTAFRPHLQKLAAKILGCPHGAEDIVQDAYVKAIESAPTAVVRQPISYLYQIVRNLAIDRYRRALLESRYFASEDEGTQVVEWARIPETIVIDRQHLQLVLKALAELPERTQCAFKLCMLEGYSQREVAKQFGVSPTLVNFMIQDARKHCYDAMKYQL